LAGGQKATVASVYTQIGDLQNIDSETHGIPKASDITGKYVDSITVTNGFIIAKMKSSNVSGSIQNGLLVLEPKVSNTGGSIEWDCYSDKNRGGVTGKKIEDTYLPEACRS